MCANIHVRANMDLHINYLHMDSKQYEFHNP